MGFELAKKIKLWPESFQVVGILTSTMKLQRYQAKKLFEDEINKLYGKWLAKKNIHHIINSFRWSSLYSNYFLKFFLFKPPSKVINCLKSCNLSQRLCWLIISLLMLILQSSFFFFGESHFLKPFKDAIEEVCFILRLTLRMKEIIKERLRYFFYWFMENSHFWLFILIVNCLAIL